MNALVQQENGLIGSEADIAALENRKDAMIIVLSDTHGEYEVFEKIIENFGADADALVFCGDGACDVVTLIEMAWADASLREKLPPVMAIVRGNGDASSYRLAVDPDADLNGTVPAMQQLNVPERIEFTAAGRNIFACHGHRHSVDYSLDTLINAAGTLSADLVFYGHTHVPARDEAEGSLILNPGSCSRPRGGTLPSFAVVSFPGNTERYRVEYFSINETIFGNFSFSIYSV
ncbi:MAG: YfcE family phosphodiesterase [Treponemataceae bacterium]|nr:YfcE family phosphodiesterase [Treponemataceae bacterium]